jgi:ferredoxin-type protein NapH
MKEKANCHPIMMSMTGRQKMRRAVLLITFLTFPLTYKYLSPYVIIDGAMLGLITGSFIYFALLFIVSLLFGRAVCGWICPAAGMQEWGSLIKDKEVRGGKLNWIKYFIWVPWVGIIIAMAIIAGGFHSIAPFHLIEHGISITVPADFIMYFFVVGIIVILSFTIGKRAFCHYVCWMSPFMIIGTRIKDLIKWPSLHLRSQPENCKKCRTCTKNCPMSLPVTEMVLSENMKNDECILCGTCADSCPQGVITYSWNRSIR